MDPGPEQDTRSKDDGRHPVALAVVRGVVDLGGRLIAGVLDHRVLIAGIIGFVVMTLGYVALLPEVERSSAAGLFLSVVSALAEIVAAGWLGWLGWGLLALVLAVGGPFVWFQDKRLRDQGTELHRLRFEQDPDRLSSGDEKQLREYARGVTPRVEVADAAAPVVGDAEMPQDDNARKRPES